MSTEAPEVVKLAFTRGRKIQQLIGVTQTGAKIPGGPYTISQAAVGVGMLFIGVKTIGFWGFGGRLMDLTVLAVLTAAAVIGIGRMPIGSRNPLLLSKGFFGVLFRPRFGHLAGKPMKLAKPVQVAHLFAAQPAAPVAEPAAAATEALPEPKKRPVPAVVKHRPVAAAAPAAAGNPPRRAPEPAAHAPVSGVQALLAAAQQRKSAAGATPVTPQKVA